MYVNNLVALPVVSGDCVVIGLYTLTQNGEPASATAESCFGLLYLVSVV